MTVPGIMSTGDIVSSYAMSAVPAVGHVQVSACYWGHSTDNLLSSFH